MKNLFLSIFFLVQLGILFSGCEKDSVNEQLSKKQMVLHAKGTATATPTTVTIPVIDSIVNAIAYTMDFFNKETGERLGTLTDYTFEPEVLADGSMIGEDFPVFTFEKDGSQIVLHNFVNLTPLDTSSMKASYMPDYDEKNVIGGAGEFTDISGKSILEAVLGVEKMAEGIIVFDCKYHINLD